MLIAVGSEENVFVIETILVRFAFAAIGYAGFAWFMAIFFSDDTRNPVTAEDLRKVAIAVTCTLVGVIILTGKYIIAA